MPFQLADVQAKVLLQLDRETCVQVDWAIDDCVQCLQYLHLEPEKIDWRPPFGGTSAPKEHKGTFRRNGYIGRCFWVPVLWSTTPKVRNRGVFILHGCRHPIDGRHMCTCTSHIRMSRTSCNLKQLFSCIYSRRIAANRCKLRTTVLKPKFSFRLNDFGCTYSDVAMTASATQGIHMRFLLLSPCVNCR